MMSICENIQPTSNLVPQCEGDHGNNQTSKEVGILAGDAGGGVQGMVEDYLDLGAPNKTHSDKQRSKVDQGACVSEIPSLNHHR